MDLYSNSSFRRLVVIAKLMKIKSVDITSLNTQYYALIYFTLSSIDIQKDNDLKESIASLCHELGHWVSYKLSLRRAFNLKNHRKSDEKLANFWGTFFWLFFVSREDLKFKEWVHFCKSIES